MSGRDSTADDGKSVPAFDLAFDLAKVPADEVVNLSFELMGREPSAELLQSATMYVDTKTALLTCWLLLPEGTHYQSLDRLRYPAGKAASPERIVPANERISPDGQLVAVTLRSLEPGFLYECRWTYPD